MSGNCVSRVHGARKQEVGCLAGAGIWPFGTCCSANGAVCLVDGPVSSMVLGSLMTSSM